MTELATNETVQLPEVHIWEVGWDDIPDLAREELLAASRVTHGWSIDPSRFDGFRAIAVAGDQNVRTYVGMETAVHPRVDERVQITYLADVTSDGTALIGHGNMWYGTEDGLPEYNRGKPTESYTQTEGPFHKLGYAWRRLLAMNAHAEREYGVPLRSDEKFETFGEHSWIRLVKQGLAERYTEPNGAARYRLLRLHTQVGSDVQRIRISCRLAVHSLKAA